MKGIFNQNKTLEFGLDFILFIVAFSIPFSSAFNSISIAVLFLYSFLWMLKKDPFYLNKNKRYIFLFLLFFGIQLVGITYSNNTFIAVKTVSKNLPFLFFPILFINLSNNINKKQIQIAIYGLLTGIILILFTAHYSILSKIINENLSIKTLFNHFIREKFIENSIVTIHTPYFGLLTIFALIASYKLNFIANKKANQIFKLFLILYLIFSIYEISAFMSQLLLVVFFIVRIFDYIKRRKMKNLFLIFILLTMTLGLIYGLRGSSKNIKGAETIFNRFEMIIHNGDNTRMENWKSVISVIQKNIAFGVGSDGGLNQLQNYRDKKSEPYINAHNAHNQYLEILLRYGLVGFVIFLVLIFKLFEQAYISKNYHFIWFMILFLIASISESLLQRQIGIVFFTFYSGLFLVNRDKKTS